jgi:hypothetical protein
MRRHIGRRSSFCGVSMWQTCHFIHLLRLNDLWYEYCLILPIYTIYCTHISRYSPHRLGAGIVIITYLRAILTTRPFKRAATDSELIRLPAFFDPLLPVPARLPESAQEVS